MFDTSHPTEGGSAAGALPFSRLNQDDSLSLELLVQPLAFDGGSQFLPDLLELVVRIIATILAGAC